LAAVASNTADSTYPRVDALDDLSPKPAFTVLIYPAYLDTEGKPEPTKDITLSAQTPPAFVLQALDDKLVTSALAYTYACEVAGVPAELHEFPKGGHGFGLRTKEPGLSGWMDLLVAWLGRTEMN
jgi:acetyl esterase/lipase